MATALASALSGIPVRGDVAMTGEITLRGRVLPIGGLREKSVAAHRHHVKHVIFPALNAKDLTELPQDVRDEVTWHPVRTMDEVIALALRHVPSAIANVVSAEMPAPKAKRKRTTVESSTEPVAKNGPLIQHSVPDQTMLPSDE